VPPEKLIVNPLGVDTARYGRSSDMPRGKPRVLFVGQVGVRKGVAYLLDAFAPLSVRAELHLVGPIEPSFEKILARAPMEGVTVHGPLSDKALMQAYGMADILCLPSIEEGFGMVLGEAMASGLAIIATKITGASELIVDGREGLLVPPADASALRAALAAVIDDPKVLSRMKEAAWARVRAGCSWDDYAARALATYRRVLGGNKP
jgi:glycosyltransferase involved in cell wall biosynthesis